MVGFHGITKKKRSVRIEVDRGICGIKLPGALFRTFMFELRVALEIVGKGLSHESTL